MATPALSPGRLTPGVPVDEERRRRSGWRRPPGLVEQTRWLFFLALLGSLVVTLPTLLVGATATTVGLFVPAGAWLVRSWFHRYRVRNASLARDLLDAAAIAALTLAGPVPTAALLLLFPVLWFRSVYGSTREVALSCTANTVGFIAATVLWGVVPGHPAEPLSPLLGIVPMLFTTAAVARHLALGMFAREQSQRRDAALNELGNQLLAITGAAEIRQRAWVAVAAVCAATPGLRLLLLELDGDHLRLVGSAGEFRDLPSTLPRDQVPPSMADGETRPVSGDGALGAAAGVRITWQCRLMPAQPDRWVLVGAPAHVPPEVVVALRVLFNQTTLALRNSTTRQELTVQARTDSLTGLANRAAFTVALAESLLATGTGATVLFPDLDDFKTVNDELGHAAGDELLRQVARRVGTSVRPNDVCGRLGGDEFAVVLPDVDADESSRVAASVAQRLVEVVAAPFGLLGRVVHVGVSVGLAHGAPGDTVERVVQCADIAMYAAKAKGKNRLQAFSVSLLQANAQTVFESELAGAVEAGQVVVHYQPITSAVDGHCTAVEALVRWQHPTRGLVPPLEFIETAERTGAITGIGDFVLWRACQDAAGWSDGLGERMRVHVNVSAAQLVDPAFVDTVRRCTTDCGMSRGQLVLEITESMVAASAAVHATLEAVVAVGVAVAVDDFGTGYSSLTTLRTLPLDIVKIDRSFVAGCPADPADRTVVEAIVQMAKKLGLSSVAEGVERPEQEAFLRKVGADAVQGFLHARPAPAPAAEFERWLRAHRSTRTYAGRVAAGVGAVRR